MSNLEGTKFDALNGVPQRKQPRWRRTPTTSRLIVALAVLALLFFRIGPSVKFPRVRHRALAFRKHPNLSCVRPAHFVMQSDHRMHHYGGELYPQAARTSFKFLPSPRTLSIDAIGTHGSVRFMLDDRDYGQPEDAASKRYISVDVTAFSDDWLGFEQTAMLCQTVPRVTGAGEISEGVMISADTDRAAANRTVFDITVRFPASDSLSLPPFSPKISATMFGFEILIDDMDNHVLFDSVFLRSMKKSIHINALRANSVQVQNWNGNISGSITSKGQIDLYAHNGAVTINADLVADEASVTSTHSPGATAPTLLVTTVYGPIDATVNLLTARSLDLFREPSDGSLPTYKTILHTINAPLTVTYPTAPEHHNLTLFASNSHALTIARLPDSFVGHLALRSQNTQRPLVVHLDEKADRHRRRLQITSVDKHGLTATVQRGSLDSDRQLGAGIVDVQAIGGDLSVML